MKFTTSTLSAFVLLATSPLVHSFVQTTKTTSIGSRTMERGPDALSLTPDDLTDYMAKAHEEKLRAVKAVEETKNVEIQTLKGEVKALKEAIPKESAVVVSTSTPPSTGMDLSKMSKEELQAKLVAYQKFMAEYIVKAQQQKLQAVQAAELATATRYEAKIKLLLGAASSEASTTAVETASAASAATKLYDTRSSKVAAAAKAGKSRWGDKEVAKVQINARDAVVEVKAEPTTEAVNGAAGISNGAAAPAAIELPGTSSFDKRNEKVAAAGKAGKSRWGDAEVQKASAEASKQPSLSSAPTTPAPPAAAATAAATATATAVSNTVIEQADHGLRNDGGVGGPSLADRVNLGQQLFIASDSTAAAPSALATGVSAAPSAYDLRNAKIAAAAAAGKSRWGSMETDKAASLAVAVSKILASAPATAAREIVSSPEIEAADHGLRNDGGVGGPSLAERVNLGLGIV